MTPREFFDYTIARGMARHPAEVQASAALKDTFTIGAFVHAVMSIGTERDATEFVEGYRDYLKDHPVVGHDADQLVRSNIGWCFGEGMGRHEMAMWRKVCNASHPYLGDFDPPPTAQEAFDAGVEAGRKMLGEVKPS